MRDKKKSHNQTVAHTEAAVEAGMDYENPHEGHNKMYNDFSNLEKKRDEPIHKSYNAHRGARIDQELEEEDKEAIRKQDEKHHRHSK
ncbi:hypothetical protein BJV82DRAFT_627137 [Fennellomyces sp. T-0311]|nr:hypothetical protein BJV82DRAFT_627137 [Fennellomyces sp. T-0311]